MRQNGSAKIFITTGVILVLIALGVLYGSKRLAMNDQTPPMQLSEQAEEQPAVEQEKADEQNSEKTDTENADSQPAEQANNDQTQTESDSQTTVSGSASSNNSDTNTDTPTTSQLAYSADVGAAATGDDLPETGPAENMTALALAMVTASGVAYVRSLRRP